MYAWGKELKKPAEQKFKKIFKHQYYNKHVTESDIKSSQNFSEEEDFVEFKSVYAPKKVVSWESELNKYLKSPRA